MKPVYFFLGANSEEGFFSLYDQLLGGRLDDLMILKGGPGCGKSTFMRRVGAAMERAGERIVYINCSGDPDSLDAAIFLDRNAAIVDGTSPHGTAPLGHRTKKVNICKALRRRKYYGLEMSRNVQSGNTQNLKSMVIQRSPGLQGQG